MAAKIRKTERPKDRKTGKKHHALLVIPGEPEGRRRPETMLFARCSPNTASPVEEPRFSAA
jgi:hypothetical protein